MEEGRREGKEPEKWGGELMEGGRRKGKEPMEEGGSREGDNMERDLLIREERERKLQLLLTEVDHLLIIGERDNSDMELQLLLKEIDVLRITEEQESSSRNCASSSSSSSNSEKKEIVQDLDEGDLFYEPQGMIMSISEETPSSSSQQSSTVYQPPAFQLNPRAPEFFPEVRVPEFPPNGPHAYGYYRYGTGVFNPQPQHPAEEELVEEPGLGVMQQPGVSEDRSESR